MTTYITINKHKIAHNARHGTSEPPVRVAYSKSGKAFYCHEVEILGPSRLISGGDKPVLKCGARIALATDAEIRIVR